MKKARVVLLLLLAFAAPMLLVQPNDAAAGDCACFDLNTDGVCDGADAIVTDAALLAGPVSDPLNTFLIPASCNIVLPTAPSGVVKVTGKRIEIRGSYLSVPNGGEGVLFTAIEDVEVNGGRVESGGLNKLFLNVAGNEAVAKSSVGFKAGTTCSFTNNAFLRGNPILGSGKVGIQCAGDIMFRTSTVIAAGVNIQSLNGEIDARSAAAIAGPTLADLCDNPVANLVGGAAAPGNNNFITDAPDFPCDLNLGAQFPGVTTFPTEASLLAFCKPSSIGGVNTFSALNNPMIFISEKDLDLSGAAGGGGDTVVEGRFRVNLAAVNGNIDTSDTKINNTSNPPGGAKIWVFADPTTVIRLPVDKEDFLGPSSGTTDIDSACYESPNPIQHGDAGAPIVGVPDPLPCRQIGDFVPVLNGVF